MIERFDKILAKVEEWVTIVGFGFTTIVIMFYVSINVIARYIFHSPVKGMVYIVGLLIVPLVYLPIAYGWRGESTFVAATFILDHIKGRARWVMELFIQICALFGLALLIGYAALKQTLWAIDTHHMAGGGDFLVPTWPFRATMVVGCLLLTLRVLVGLLKFLRGTGKIRDLEESKHGD